MSQIRKLQGGGNASTWGKLIIDGTEYNMNDENVRKAFLNHLSTTSNNYGDYYSDVLDALRSGQTIVGDSISNRFTSGINSFRVNTDKENAILNDYENDRQKSKDARKNNNVHKSKVAIRNVLSFVMPSEKKEEDQDEINNDLKVFEYSDEGGFAKNSAVNQGLRDRLNYYYDYFSDPGTWSYKWSSPHYGASEGDLKAWYQSLGGDYESRRAELKRLAEAALAEAETAKSWDDVSADSKRILSYFNIGIPKESSSGSKSEDSDKVKADTIKKWQTAGYNTDKLYDTIGDYFELDDEGVLTLKPGLQFNLGDWHNGRNIYFNDDFYKSQYGKDHRLDALNGLTYYNGKLYQLGNKHLYDILAGEGGYNELMKKGNWQAAQNEIMTNFSRGAQDDYGSLGKDQFSQFFYDNPNYRFKNLTGAYDLVDGKLGKNERLVSYVDIDNPYVVEGNPYLNYEAKYAVLDKYGNWVRDVNFEDLRETGEAANDYDAFYDRVYGTGDDYEGMYRKEFVDQSGNPTGIWIYRNPEDPNRDVILHVPGLKGSRVGENPDIKLPPNIAELLLNNNNFISNIIRSKKLLDRFVDVISRLTTSGFRYNAFYHDRPGIERELRSLGFNKEEASTIWQAIRDEKRAGGNTADRVDQYVRYGPRINRMGGKVAYISKLAKGGVSGGSTKTTEKGKQVTVSGKAKNPGDAAGIFEGDWTSADYADLVALGADLASAGVILADPTNIAGALSGVGASLARFKADTTRHRLNPDAGKGAGWNLALNLGMDAVSLIPILGDATKVAQTANGIRKALPTILKLVSVAGMGDAAATAAIKIANGEKWTVRDLSLVANAVTSGIALGKTGGFGKSKKTTKSKGYTSETVKIGDAPEKELTGDAIEKIVKSSDQKTALEEELKRLFPEAESTAVSKKASEMLSKKQTLWQKIRKKEGDNVLERSKTKSKNTEEVEANGNWLHDWWYGLGDKRAAHLAQLRGEGTPTRDYSGVKYSRTDVKEAPGTTRGARYYKDEYGTTYRKGEVKSEDILADQLDNVQKSIPKSHRTGINDSEGNFTGKVKVEVVKPKEKWSVPYQTFKYPNYWSVPNIMLFDHSKIGYQNESAPPLTYSTMKRGGVLKAQSGTYNLGFDYGLTHKELPYKVNPITGKPELNLPDPTKSPFEIDLFESNPYKKPEWMKYLGSSASTTPISDTQVSGTTGTSTGAGSQSNPGFGGGEDDKIYPKEVKGIPDWILGAGEAVATIAGNNAGFRESTKHTLNVPMMPGYTPELMPTTGNSALVHQESWLRGMLSNGMKQPVSSNPIINAAIKQQHDSEIFNRLKENTAAQSQWQQQNMIENLGIINQAKLAEQQRVGNWLQSKYYAQQAVDNAKRANILGNTSVITNLMRENRLKLKQDRELGLAATTLDYQQALQKSYDNKLKGKFKEEWAEYQTVDDRSEYTDFEDFLQKKYPTKYNASREYFDNLKQQMNSLLQDYRIRQRYNFPIFAPDLVETEKKGGRLNGRTRYTLEPDERIWIENIKAQHKSVDKANEAAIKLLLKALK